VERSGLGLGFAALKAAIASSGLMACAGSAMRLSTQEVQVNVERGFLRAVLLPRVARARVVRRIEGLILDGWVGDWRRWMTWNDCGREGLGNGVLQVIYTQSRLPHRHSNPFETFSQASKATIS